MGSFPKPPSLALEAGDESPPPDAGEPVTLEPVDSGEVTAPAHLDAEEAMHGHDLEPIDFGESGPVEVKPVLEEPLSLPAVPGVPEAAERFTPPPVAVPIPDDLDEPRVIPPPKTEVGESEFAVARPELGGSTEEFATTTHTEITVRPTDPMAETLDEVLHQSTEQAVRLAHVADGLESFKTAVDHRLVQLEGDSVHAYEKQRVWLRLQGLIILGLAAAVGYLVFTNAINNRHEKALQPVGELTSEEVGGSSEKVVREVPERPQKAVPSPQSVTTRPMDDDAAGSTSPRRPTKKRRKNRRRP